MAEHSQLCAVIIVDWSLEGCGYSSVYISTHFMWGAMEIGRSPAVISSSALVLSAVMVIPFCLSTCHVTMWP